jgi:hypothetical protein
MRNQSIPTLTLRICWERSFCGQDRLVHGALIVKNETLRSAAQACRGLSQWVPRARYMSSVTVSTPRHASPFHAASCCKRG